MTKMMRLIGRFFQGKVNRLEIAFAAACKPFHDDIERVERAAARHQAEVDAGRAVWDEVTDDGDHYSYGEQFGEERDEAEEALHTLRKAFCFLIYHQWERTSQRWSAKKNPVHADLIAGAQAQGIPLDVAGLEVLRLLVNTLKHNSSSCGPALFALRPDLFESGFAPNATNALTGQPPKSINWADGVSLTDSNIADFFKTVSASVPC